MNINVSQVTYSAHPSMSLHFAEDTGTMKTLSYSSLIANTSLTQQPRPLLHYAFLLLPNKRYLGRRLFLV